MVKVTIPITAVEKGKEYVIPVNISGLPKDVSAFDFIVTTEKSLVELDDIEIKGTMVEKAGAFFHNSDTVWNQPKEGEAPKSNGINTEWKSPFNRGCMFINCASSLPLTGKVLVKLKVWAADSGNAVFNAAYLNYNQKDWQKGTITAFGKMPEMIHLTS
jgi:hypothetical protein